ncbi:MAG TPA: DinB family protein [Gemmatimonadales bacterium]|nr:DinB family protein [Gemmatimonadales bacterium]
MTASIPATAEIEVLQLITRSSNAVVQANVAGITHDESLVQPQPGGNCLNFILGHLVATYDGALSMVGQEPVLPQEEISRYNRGSEPVTDSGEAIDFGRLLSAWDEASRRFDAGLATVSPEFLDQKAGFSPSGNPDETNRSLLATIAFHQAYHAGQTALSRRLVGKPGAIK